MAECNGFVIRRGNSNAGSNPVTSLKVNMKIFDTYHIGISFGGELWPIPGVKVHKLTAFSTYTVGWLYFGIELMVFYDEIREGQGYYWHSTEYLKDKLAPYGQKLREVFKRSLRRQ